MAWRGMRGVTTSGQAGRRRCPHSASSGQALRETRRCAFWRLELVVDPGGGGGGGLEDGVLVGLGGVGWELEGVVGVGDYVEGVEVRGARGRGRACGAVRTGRRGALGSSMVLGPVPGSSPGQAPRRDGGGRKGRGARGRGRACGAVRTGWRGALGSIMALGPRPGSRPGQAPRGDDVVGVGLESGWCGFWGV